MTTPTTVNVRLQLRADTAANWTAANPILLANEVGLETDTKKLKVGNGSTAWNSLAYFPSIVSGGTVLGNLEIGSTGTLTFEGSTADGFETTLAVTNPTADRTITLPNQSGTVVVSGNASIVNADIAANAEIAVSKLANGTANQVIVTDGTNVSWSDNLTLAGDLTVNGTTTTINTQDLLVEDKNIIIGNVDTPTDVTADGGGITLKGATDKTINWVDSTDAWTSSERFSVPLGSAASPSLTFTGDENSGLYSPGADQVAVATNGAGRLFVDASGNVGVGLSSPQRRLHVVGDDGSVSSSPTLGAKDFLVVENNGNSNLSLVGGATSSTALKFFASGSSTPDGQIVYDFSNDNLGLLSTGTINFSTAANERLRIDSSGRLLVGTSSSQTGSNTAYARLQVLGNSSGAAAGGLISIGRTEAATSITSGESLGTLVFGDSGAAEFAWITCEADAIAAANDYPGRLVFATTADGASFPTERMRISNNGTISIGYTASTDHRLGVRGGSAENVVIGSDSSRAQGSGWYSFYGTSDSATVLQSFVRGDGVYGSRTSTYGGLSDARLKENVVDAQSQWGDVKSIRFRNFNLIGDSTRQLGVIAQEIEQISPGLVDEINDRDEQGNETGTSTKLVKYSILYMKAVKALQEAMERIELLEARLDAANL